MSKRKTYSISRLVMQFFLFLFIVTVLLTLLYFNYFMQITYENSLSYFEVNAERSATTLKNDLSVIRRQLSWIAASANDNAYRKSSNAYERMQYSRNQNNSLRGILRASRNIDAAIIIQRSSDIILESHTMGEDAFLRLLGLYGGQRSTKPVSPALFYEYLGNNPTHIILRQPIITFDNQGLYSQVVADVFFAVRLDSLLEGSFENEIYCLCVRSGDELRAHYTRGIDTDIFQKNFSMEELEEKASIMLNNVDYMVSLHSLEAEDLYLLNLQPRQILLERVYPALLQGLAMVGSVLLLSIYMIVIITKRIRRPVRDIIIDIRRISDGDYAHRFLLGDAKELKQISVGINGLLDELDQRTVAMVETQKKLYDTHLLHQKSQLIALQSQINPHFLYNTLECIRSIAQSNNIAEISSIISAMIKIYRYSVTSFSMGTVASEVACAKNYTEIMCHRFGDRYVFEFDIQSDIAEVPMPKLVLQPLIENAISHGLANKSSMGTITICCKKQENLVLIYILDNGIGIPVDRLQQLRCRLDCDELGEEKVSIGLHNVHQRLKREYGEKYGISVDSIEGEFTKVIIRIPITTPPI